MGYIRQILSLALAALAIPIGTGCAGQAHLMDTTSQSPADDVGIMRAAVVQLREHRYAKDAALEVERASRWLDQTERAIEAGDGDDDHTSLVLAAARSQVAMVKSFYLRREADDALEAARSGFVSDRDEVRSIRDSNRELEK